MSDTYISDVGGDRIDPATEDLQREILAKLDLVQNRPSSNWGTERLVVGADGLAKGSNHSCKECWVSFDSTNSTYLSVNEGDDDATIESFKIPENEVIKVPIVNTNRLHFKGTAADSVYLIFFS